MRPRSPTAGSWRRSPRRFSARPSTSARSTLLASLTPTTRSRSNSIWSPTVSTSMQPTPGRWRATFPLMRSPVGRSPSTSCRCCRPTVWVVTAAVAPAGARWPSTRLVMPQRSPMTSRLSPASATCRRGCPPRRAPTFSTTGRSPMTNLGSSPSGQPTAAVSMSPLIRRLSRPPRSSIRSDVTS